jgi:hypothetical protein
MKKSFLLVLLCTGASLCSLQASAQDTAAAAPGIDQKITDYKPGSAHFMIAGLTTIGFVMEKNTTMPSSGGPGLVNKNSSFGDADRYEFSPMFLWRQGDRVLLEFEPSYTGGNTLSVNWADVSYFLAPGCIVRAGYFVLPFGIYAKRLAAGWINKLTSDPIGMDMPGSDFGVEVEGGFPIGSMKLNYDVAVSNGFQMDSTGVISGVGITSPNLNKTVCGRVGLLPHAGSNLEIGFSALGGNLYAPQNYNYANPTVMMYAFDLSYYKKIGMVTINVKGQYNIQNVNNQNYLNPLDTINHTATYTFKNMVTAGFGQFSIRPTGLENFAKNLELGYRYVLYNTPDASLWGQNWTENDICLNYWLTWRQVIKIGYENISNVVKDNQTVGVSGSTTNTSRFILQFSTQL